MSTREPEAADITAAYEVFAKRAVETFNEKGQCWAQLAAITLGDEPGSVAHVTFVDPVLVNAMQRDERTKDALAILIRVLLGGKPLPVKGDKQPQLPPQIAVHLTEAWVLSQDAPKGATPEEIRAAALGPHEQLKDHPERREAILVSVHTAERSYHGMCPVTRSADGKGVAEYAPMPTGGQWAGRFTHTGSEQ